MWKVILYLSFIILFHVSLIATDKKSNKEIIDQTFRVMNECNKTFNVDMAHVESFRETGNFPDETDKIPKCFIRCVLIGMDVITDDEKFKPAEAAIFYCALNMGTDVKEVEEIATSCIDRNEKCKCERGYEYLRCIKTPMMAKAKKS